MDDMTPTDKLRALLDERGIEWWPDKYYKETNTVWRVGNFEWRASEQKDGRLLIGCTCIETMTPEQVIAATVGVGTCHYYPDDTGFTWWDENDVEHHEEDSASDDCGSASCDKCGFTMMVGDCGWFKGWDEITEWWDEHGRLHKGYLLKPDFKHCPNCGRKVVGA